MAKRHAQITGTCEITELDPVSGFGVGELRGRAVLVPYTLPGEQAAVERIRKRKRRLVADQYTITRYSAERAVPECEHFGLCGGDILQHVPYPQQLQLKARRLEQTLRLQVPVMASAQPYGYRNRIDVAVTDTGIGYKVPGKWWRTVDIPGCMMFGERSYRALQQLRNYMAEHGLEPWNPRHHTGFVRYLTLREGKHTGEMLVNCITADGALDGDLGTVFPEADSVYWSVNDGAADIAVGIPQQQWGQQHLHETLNGLRYAYGPNTFFQVNPGQTQHMLATVCEWVTGRDVLDMYCGVGTIALQLAAAGATVAGIELDSEAVALARANARDNALTATFEEGSDHDVHDLARYETVIVDPPRSGMHRRLRDRLVTDRPQEIIYVSCNPQALAEDLAALTEYYTVTDVQGFDMFPQTPHIEAVARLVRSTYVSA